MPMVYIKQIEPKTFLHFSSSKENFVLRDFSPPHCKVATIVKEQLPPEWTATRIRQLASVGTNRLIKVPSPTVDDYDYWHRQTVELNHRFGIPEPTGTTTPPHVVVVTGGWKDHLATIIGAVVATVLGTGLLIWLKWK